MGESGIGWIERDCEFKDRFGDWGTDWGGGLRREDGLQKKVYGGRRCPGLRAQKGCEEEASSDDLAARICAFTCLPMSVWSVEG